MPLTAPRPRPSRPARLVAAVALSGALVLSGCGGSSHGSTAKSTAAKSAAKSGAKSGAPTSAAATSGAAPASPGASGSAPAGGAGSTAPGGAPGGGAPTSAPTTGSGGGGGSGGAGGCATADLALVVDGSTRSGGRTLTSYELTDIGTDACTLTGYPGVTGTGADGAVAAGPASQDAGLAGTSGGPATITLQPGDRAQFTVGTGSGSCPVAAIQVYPPGQTDAITLTTTTSLCSPSVGFLVSGS